MFDLEYHANRLWNELALHRFHIHQEEVKRVLKPMLELVYARGVSDTKNTGAPEPLVEKASPLGTIEATLQVIHHGSNESEVTFPEPEPIHSGFAGEDPEPEDGV